KASAIKAPGMMYSHYAPKTPLRLNATSLQDQEVGLGFGTNEFPALGSLNLSPEGNLETAAANLFAYLHDLDVYATKHRLKSIAVAKIPNESVGKAINDRLIKAATDSLFTGID